MERIRVEQLHPHIYLMDDAGQASGYVVVGQKKALVIDTMNGYEDVKAAVRQVTDLPLMVVNTHGHCDHIFGNIFFEEAYLHPLDRKIASDHSRMPDFQERIKVMGLFMPPFRDIQGGDEIDLGGLTIQVIHVPGHTPGSILLLLKEDRVLFTGDDINRHLWLQLEESLPVEEYRKELEKVLYLTKEADHILHGHAGGFEPISLIKELYEGVQELCAGNTEKDSDYSYFDGNAFARLHPFGDGNSAIIYPKK